MPAAAEFSQDVMPAVRPVRMVDGARMVMRGTQRFLGVSLTLAALGLWLMPGSSFGGDVMLFKLILSLTAVLAGLGLVCSSAGQAKPEIEIDTIRREVRLVRRVRGTPDTVIKTARFSELSRVDQSGNAVRLWDADSVLLAEVVMTDRAALGSLLSGLRDEGKVS